MILFSHIHAETFAPFINCVIRWRFITRNDARHRSSAASVHQRHELARPAAAFLHIFWCQNIRSEGQ